MAVVAKDVAKKAGVSVTAVSRALRGKRDIGVKTRQKIQKAAKDLGYAPNAFASALSSGYSNTLGITVQDMHYLCFPYIGSIVGGIATVSDENGFSLGFARSANGNSKGSEYLCLARERRFDGIVMIDQIAKKSELRLLSEMKVPVVLVDRRIPGLGLPSVCIDYRKSVKEIISHLVGLGHRRIAVISLSESLMEFKEKLCGYRESLQEHKIPYDQNLVKIDSRSDNIVQWVEESVDELECLQEPPTAYLSFQDTRTSLLCEILRDRGLNIPGNVSVVGFECADSQYSNSYTIGAAKVPCHEIGVRACQLLLDLIKGQVATRGIVLEATFEPKGSCSLPGR